ncbi:MAG: hypothetical protein ACREFQ_11260 [Stellaceae bacterium]
MPITDAAEATRLALGHGTFSAYPQGLLGLVPQLFARGAVAFAPPGDEEERGIAVLSPRAPDWFDLICLPISPPPGFVAALLARVFGSTPCKRLNFRATCPVAEEFAGARINAGGFEVRGTGRIEVRGGVLMADDWLIYAPALAEAGREVRETREVPAALDDRALALLVLCALGGQTGKAIDAINRALPCALGRLILGPDGAVLLGGRRLDL